MNNEEILLEIKLSYTDALNGMAKLTAANEDLSRQLKQQKDELKALTSATNADEKAKLDAASAVAASEAEYKKNTETMKIYQGVLIENIKYEEDIRNSYGEVSTQLMALTDAYNNMSDAERQSAEGQNLQQQISDTASKFHELKQAFDENKQNIGSFKTETVELRNQLGTLAGKLAPQI